MPAARFFTLVLVALVQTSSADFSGLRASPASQSTSDTKLAETVKALDTNGNGKVDMSELTGFAKSQGLSTNEVLADFKELDINHDGALDSSEIGPLFGVAADAADASVNQEVAAKPVAAAAASVLATKAVEVDPLAALAAEDPKVT